MVKLRTASKTGSKPVTHSLRYGQLLGSIRLRQSTNKRSSPGLEALSDKSRIISSSAFRRLQSKAQVFSMARSGTVRTRLTHSIEVSNYGELIAESIADELCKQGHLAPELRLPFVQTVENACLLHDIGNPPFGHMGEYAIGHWFKDYGQELRRSWADFLAGDEAEHFFKCMQLFDGNPQGLRVVSRLQWLGDEHGLNLTCALLASYMKYLGKSVDSSVKFYKKLGFFPGEEAVVRNVWSTLGLKTTPDGLPAQRHPLAFIMEAADDIAYCLSDIEDGLERRIITEQQVLESLKGKVGAVVKRAQEAAERAADLAPSNARYHFVRLEVSRVLVEAACKAYLLHHEQILDGTFSNSLLGSDVQACAILDAVRAFAGANIYSHREVVEVELGGLRAIQGLLERFMELLKLRPDQFAELQDTESSDKFRNYPVPTLLYSLLPKKHLQVYDWQVRQNKRLEPLHRTQLVVDYISGMTDSHALKVYNILNGTQPFTIE